MIIPWKTILLVWICCQIAGAAEPALEKPNIIFIMADDMGYADAGLISP